MIRKSETGAAIKTGAAPAVTNRRRAGLCGAILVMALMAGSAAGLGQQAGEINVARPELGARARADSVFDTWSHAGDAINGMWLEWSTDLWKSAQGEEHWLAIDFPVPRKVSRVLIRHAGVVGAHGQPLNTRDFRIQGAADPQGPWTDLVDPVRGNSNDLTEHAFPPTSIRSLRILITRGEQGEGSNVAHLYDVQAFVSIHDLETPLIEVDFGFHKFRNDPEGTWRLARARVLAAKLPEGVDTLHLKAMDRTLAEIRSEALNRFVDLWLPATEVEAPLLLELFAGEEVVARKSCPWAQPGFFHGGQVHIIASSHQDVAWMDTPAQCVVDRDRFIITPALERMTRNPEYHFGMEQVMNLMEYLERHPERREEVLERTREGRFEWGATFNQPYESLESGEQLVRQLYFGRKWLKKALPGCDARVAFNVDVPGRTLQMPQILCKAGVPYLMISRFEEGFFQWQSPDGSAVQVHSSGNYGQQLKLLTGKQSMVFHKIMEKMDPWQNYYRALGMAPEFGIFASTDMAGPPDHDALMAAWNEQAGCDSHDPTGGFITPPRIVYSTGERFMDAATAGDPPFKVIRGERPNVWLYIHGPAHHHAISAKRAAGRLLPGAETFSTFEALLAGSFEHYPQERLNDAWMASIYPDHGWGGNQGHITDQVFRKKLEFARDEGEAMLSEAEARISRRIKTDLGKGMPVVVFNALSRQRSDPVCLKVRTGGQGFTLMDSKGAPVPHQILEQGEEPSGGTKILFIARQVPSLGYKTYYLKTEPPDRESLLDNEPATPLAKRIVENDFFRMELAPGGMKSLFDKTLNRELLETDKFLGCEVFTLESEGNGAGEFLEVQQPTLEGFDKVSLHKPGWTQVEAGPVRTAFTLEQDLGGARVKQTLILYHRIKRIDCRISLLAWKGAKSREFRMALPLALEGAKIAYDVPMGVVEVGKDEVEGAAGGTSIFGEYTQVVAEVRPREVQDFIHAGDKTSAVTLSSSVAVCDFQDPTTPAADYPILQPVLLASRRSCHGMGNWYLQAGDHHYTFSIFSHEPGWEGGSKLAAAANHPLRARLAEKPTPQASLPEEQSFCSLSCSNVQVTTIKKCEDDHTVILRAVELEGRDGAAEFLWPWPLKQAHSTNLIEEGGRPIPWKKNRVEMKMGHHAIETLKLVFEKQL